MEEPNLKYIHDLSGGVKGFENKLLDIIKAEFPDEKEIYNKNIGLKNFNEAADNVHKLKHKISIFGLEKSYELAVVHENALREGNDSLQTEFDSVLNKISKYLSKF
jgi:HPt (histidine-containing phosphotransfer) domain-containing protein